MASSKKILLPLALASALMLSACGSNGDADTSANGSTDGGDTTVSGSLTVYTSEPQEKIDEIIDAFEEQYPDAEVNVFRAATGELKTRIATEKETGQINADVLLAADVPTFEGYSAEGDLQQLDVDNDEALEDAFVDEDGYWVGTRIIPTIIAVNTDVMDDQRPESWNDLTDEAYSGQVSMPNPDVSGAAAFNTAVWLDNDDLGEDWMTDLVANNPTVLESNGPVGQAVAAGTTGLGIVVDYVIRELAAEGSPVEVIYPTEGVPYVSQPAGVFADAQNPELANAFVDFLISEEGQAIAVDQAYLPVRDDVGVPEGAPELGDLELMDPDLEHIADIQEESIDFFNGLLDN